MTALTKYHIHFDPKNYKDRDFENEDYVGEEEIASLIYGTITKLNESDFKYGFDVDEFIYDHISNFDQFYDDGEGGYMGWYIDDDTDEKDGLRDRIYEEIGLTYKDEDGDEFPLREIEIVEWDDLIKLEYWNRFK